MSYILTPIAVDLGRIASLIGSGDDRLVGVLVEEFGHRIKRIDKMAADHAEDIEAEAATTVRDALAQMVNGERYDEEVGFVYGYALEFVCEHLGECLPNEGWSGIRAEWAEMADEALGSVGVDEAALRLGSLMYRGSPVPLPAIDDFPFIGYLRGPEIKAALEAFDEERLTRVGDDEMRSSLAELRGWLRRCEASGRDLICFYA
ncbi:hypothetical protein AB1L88_16115 [Tautonia sp. JC769]|uniref:DUF7691 family protein n=1 Tax=Tautonia sp. JC769 TaxID=3232135 RepID=UPI003458042A